jgi:hypothetical protein
MDVALRHRHHAVIAHDDHSPQPESPMQILDCFPHRGLVQPIAGEHVMGDLPAVHHHYTHRHPPGMFPLLAAGTAMLAGFGTLKRQRAQRLVRVSRLPS